ncbi:conserved hypothetical protein [Paraburkholderia piptadeniae]|uniref:GIY-YIG domain-containing protein n=1 Tax=Paraburkholderia piptadeniae TaxID=1701573 RepID=A0A1N7RZE1_9BURK|nr:hypothetical protein [Paraburkholderia piptadeniae]SIT40095.1 conserved hypothetical protein [Paraburkholderia piptadeniae]
MKVDLSEFDVMRFPDRGSIVYVLLYVPGSENEAVPFYVGESSKHVGRIGDYVTANFSASTDFKVGEAVRYLQSKGLPVLMKYKESGDRKAEERIVLDRLRSTYRLLNDLKGYDYRQAEKEQERLKIHAFIDELIYAETVRSAVSSEPLSAR